MVTTRTQTNLKRKEIGDVTQRNKARREGTKKDTLAGSSTPEMRLRIVNEARINRGLETIKSGDLPENRIEKLGEKKTVKAQPLKDSKDVQQVGKPVKTESEILESPENINKIVDEELSGNFQDEDGFARISRLKLIKDKQREGFELTNQEQLILNEIQRRENKNALKILALGGAVASGLQSVKTTGEAAITGGRAVITRMKSAHELIQRTGKLAPRGTIQTQRAFIGKPANTNIDKIFLGARRYATNTKSIKGTNNLLKIIGATGGILSIIGTYPFAGFIKEESLQTLSFGTKTAFDEDDLEGAEQAINEQDELLNPGVWDKIINFVPFVNTQKQLANFFKAAQVKLNIDKRKLVKLKGGN